MIRIKLLSKEKCIENKYRIGELLYLNDKAHDYTESCTLQESMEEVEDMINYIEDDKADVFCAYNDDNIIGLIWGFPFKFRDEQRFHIKAMVVDPVYRKRGLSQLLLSKIEEAARKRSINVIDTYVDWSNKKAIGAYEKFGLSFDRVLVRKKIVD